VAAVVALPASESREVVSQLIAGAGKPKACHLGGIAWPGTPQAKLKLMTTNISRNVEERYSRLGAFREVEDL
jgi:hypothetical protein